MVILGIDIGGSGIKAAPVDVKAGELFTVRNVRAIRPGYGLPPKESHKVLGRRARTDIRRGTPMSWNLVN